VSWDTYISVASNLDPVRHIEAALEALAALAPITGLSEFYVTAPIGRPDQPVYYNGVVRLNSPHAPRALKQLVLRPLEERLGRLRSDDKYAARTIDLDILLAGDVIVADPDLTLPDPDLHTRPFLAAAVLDIDPLLQLPGEEVPLAAHLGTEARGTLTPAADFSRRMKERYTR
jgi:2-amino-4-hydroxy-6-hydroxymethyldihydropteridine diphosphokinase